MWNLAQRLRPQGVLWHNRDFLCLWSGQTISQFGSQITGLALPLVAILLLDASAFEVAALGVVEFVPFILFSLPAGAWVDRLRRRPILIVADWGRAVGLATVPLAYFLDALTMGQLYVVGFVVGAFTVVFDVSYQSYLPSLVERDELPDANGKLEVTRSAAQTAGPGAAGVLISAFSAPFAILIDAISFLASALFVTAIRREESLPEREATEKGRLRSEIAVGLRFVVRHPIMRPNLIYVSLSNFFYSAVFSIYLVYAVRDLDLSAATIGIIGSLGSLGTLAGAIVASRLGRDFGTGPVMIGAAAAGNFSLFFIPLASGTLVIPLLVASGLILGFSAVVYNVVGISLSQQITPDRMLGRMNASRRFVVWGVIPLGMLGGGALGTAIGLRETMWIAAGCCSLCFLTLFASPLRAIRTVADAEQLVGGYNERFTLSSASTSD
ncbi:MAG: MFS transporter [Actinobacteria bacterium]|nr:MFS transporter [Actinomycetota bacterium]